MHAAAILCFLHLRAVQPHDPKNAPNLVDDGAVKPVEGNSSKCNVSIFKHHPFEYLQSTPPVHLFTTKLKTKIRSLFAITEPIDKQLLVYMAWIVYKQ